ncbi:MAG: serine acetyltransferase [Deltaproteobacteria bacterium]|nr:serine acetyltransferase [Deltaproteobacteria bacterium]
MSTEPTSDTHIALSRIVDELWQENERLVAGRRRKLGRHVLPSRSALVEVMDGLRAALFPGHFGAVDLSQESTRYYVGATLDSALQVLHHQMYRGLVYGAAPDEEATCEARALALTRRFCEALPGIRRLLASDVQAAYDGDPALDNVDEAVFCYPGINALVHHRVAHAIGALGVPLIPRIISEYAHSLTGIDIHPGARIGESFFIDHGTGVVIGETAVIGDRVRLYQGVTLGAKSFPLDEHGNPVKGIPRHPIVEDDVTIYAGATILGRVTIGRGSSIGGNVWLTRSVPAGSRITQAQSRVESFQDGAGI